MLQRRFIVAAVKIALAAVLLTWLVRTDRLALASFADIRWTLRAALAVAVQIGLVVGGLFLLARRLCLLLAVVGIAPGLRRAGALTAIGSFTGSFLPGVVGGDVVKAAMLARSDAPRLRSAVVVTVLVDRAVGIFSLLLLGALAYGAALLANGRLTGHLDVLAVAPVVVVVAVLAVAALQPLVRRAVPGSPAPRRTPAWLWRFLTASAVFLAAPGLLLRCTALSLLNHVLVCNSYLVAAWLLGGVPLTALDQFLLNPLAMMLNAVPLTPGGVGMAEIAFSYLYDAVGVANGADIGLLGRVILYAAYALAGITGLIWTPRAADPAP